MEAFHEPLFVVCSQTDATKTAAFCLGYALTKFLHLFKSATYLSFLLTAETSFARCSIEGFGHASSLVKSSISDTHNAISALNSSCLGVLGAERRFGKGVVGVWVALLSSLFLSPPL